MTCDDMVDAAANERDVPTAEDVLGVEAVRAMKTDGYWRDVSVIQYLLDWAVTSPQAPAVTDEDGTTTVGELADAVNNVAGWLVAHGVKPGDRVLVQMPNWREAVVAVLGIHRFGGIVVPAQPVLRAAEISALVERTNAVAAFVPREYKGFDHYEMMQKVAAESSHLREVIAVRGTRLDQTPFEDVTAFASYAGEPPSADQPFGIVFTSGTTSSPKGCLHTSNTITFSGRVTGESMGMTSDDVVFMPSPILHTTGMVVGLIAPLVHRAHTVLQAAWDPARALQMISRHGCTVTLGATAFARMMLDAFVPETYDVSRFRLFALGGSPVPAEVVHQLHDLFECKVMAAYGSTEALVVAVTDLDDPVERITSSDGRPVRGAAISVRTGAGEEAGIGQEGELFVQAPGRFLYYWRDLERTRADIDEQGYLRTGDIARIDEHGYMRIVGRTGDIINRGGIKFAPAEIEELLIRHPQIADVVIVPMTDRRLGQKSCAFIVAPEGERAPSVLELDEYLTQEGVARHKHPEEVIEVDELPRTPSGKVERYKLAARANSGVSA